MSYRLFIPPQAVSANLPYFDCFNATGSGKEIQFLYILPVVDTSVAVTGLVGVNLFLTRTTAVGTGGTAATLEGTALDAATFTALDQDPVLPAQITARKTPSGGATAGAVISLRSLFSEETSAAAYMLPPDFLHPLSTMRGLRCKENQGIRVVQGSVASVGSIGFDVVFNVIPKP